MAKFTNNHPRPLPAISARDVSRFWGKVNLRATNECWEWNACSDHDGYGVFNLSGRNFGSHRVAYTIIHNAEPPADTPFVCHSCDNPPCCNPAHLWAGTHGDNIRDCVAKGLFTAASGAAHWSRRMPERVARGNRNGAYLHKEKLKRGSSHYMARFTEAEIVNILTMLTQGRAVADVARIFSVRATHVYKIRNREIWAHVTL